METAFEIQKEEAIQALQQAFNEAAKLLAYIDMHRIPNHKNYYAHDILAHIVSASAVLRDLDGSNYTLNITELVKHAGEKIGKLTY